MQSSAMQSSAMQSMATQIGDAKDQSRFAAIKASFWVGFLSTNAKRRGDCDLRADELPNLEAVQHIRDKSSRKVPAQPLQGRGVLLKECRQVGSGLVLLAEDEVLILIEDLAASIVQRN
jgi:hypothetical protein